MLSQKSPGRGRPGLLPPCRRAGPTGECASLGDVTMQPLSCGYFIQVAIPISGINHELYKTPHTRRSCVQDEPPIPL